MSSLIASEDRIDSSSPTQTGQQPFAVRLEDVAVCYRVPRERIASFKEYAIRALQGGVRHDDFWALKGVSFDIYAGEIFGLIGRNGAGKSTLLKAISRVMIPTRGRVIVHGQVAPLLELGAGFHSELTGRENVFLNGALLGHTTSTMNARLAEIIEFAEVGDFIDAPLRTYSSGMVSRLGFAVATATRPDILIVDEVLSVGDAAFQEKCLDRIREFQLAGTTVIFTSHAMVQVSAICTRAAWIDAGSLRGIGPAAEIVDQYLEAPH